MIRIRPGHTLYWQFNLALATSSSISVSNTVPSLEWRFPLREVHPRSQPILPRNFMWQFFRFARHMSLNDYNSKYLIIELNDSKYIVQFYSLFKDSMSKKLQKIVNSGDRPSSPFSLMGLVLK